MTGPTIILQIHFRRFVARFLLLCIFNRQDPGKLSGPNPNDQTSNVHGLFRIRLLVCNRSGGDQENQTISKANSDAMFLRKVAGLI